MKISRPDDRSLRVVARAPNWLGDLIMALPALEAIRAHFPASTFAVAAPVQMRPLLAAVPGFDMVLPLTGDRGEDTRTLAAGRFDIGILLTNSFRSAWMLRRAGIPERWGYRTDFRGWLLSRAVSRPRRRRGDVMHQADYYGALIERLGITPSAGEPRLPVTTRMRDRGRAMLEQGGVDPRAVLIGIASGAAYGHAKQWPASRFVELIAGAGREWGATAVLLGSAADRASAAEIESKLVEAGLGSSHGSKGAGRVLNLTGHTDLQSFAGVLSYCRALVTNDSGAMHVAAALGVPVVAMFGPTDERATAPRGRHVILTHPVWCRPCHLRECPIDHRCMKRITAAQALDALRVVLDHAPA